MEFDPATKWVGVDVREHKHSTLTMPKSSSFARHRVGGGKAVRLHERSRFVREEGRWFYVEGDIR